MEAPQKLFHFFTMDQPGKGQLYEIIVVEYQGRIWKFIRYIAGEIVYEIFDLTNDPVGHHNLYGKVEYQPIETYLFWLMDSIHPNFA